MVKDGLARTATTLAALSGRYVPDAFAIASVLSLLTLLLGILVGGATPAQAVLAWGNGFWSLLSFSMQIAVVIFAGYVLAVAPPVQRLLDALAGIARTPRQAVFGTAFLSMTLCWLNWGMGLIASAVLVRMMARRHPGADYRLLVAAAYLGLGTTWHGGPSGSVPLLLATPDSFMIRDGLLAAPVPLAATIFTPENLAFMAVVTLGLSVLAASLHPRGEGAVQAEVKALDRIVAFCAPSPPATPTPADRLMHSPWLNRAIGGLGLAYVALQARAAAWSPTLDSVNLVVLTLALLLHPSAASVVRAAEEASRPLHGVVLQFPLYAGIYGIIKDTGLAEALAHAFLAIATPSTFPFVVFVYSAILNYWVPSGGAKWAMEAPYLLDAARALGVGPARVAMAYAYGDMATNLIQPFWAIPLLGVARLEFRDILGFELLFLAVYGTAVAALLLFF